MTDLRGSLIRTDHRDDSGPTDRPVAALDLHLDLIGWLATTHGAEARHRWWDAYGRGYDRSDNMPRHERWMEERDFLDRAVTMYLQPDMAELCLALAEADPTPDPLRVTDPWCPHGLVFLPPGQELHYFAMRQLDDDDYSEHMTVRALGWETNPHIGQVGGLAKGDPPGGGVQLWIYSDRDALRVEMERQARLVHDEPWTETEFRVLAGPLPLMDSTAWAYNARWKAVPDTAEQPFVDADGVVHLSEWVNSARLWVKRLWRLLDEQIVEPERWRPPRAAARRMARAAPRRLDGDVVRIIRLRRIYDEHTGDELLGDALARRFTHSWRVREHWRHLPRGQGYLDDDGSSILLDTEFRWQLSTRGQPIRLRLTDAEGRQARAELVGTPNEGIARLNWATDLRGVVDVERMSFIPDHTAGLGLLIERYDVVALQR